MPFVDDGRTWFHLEYNNYSLLLLSQILPILALKVRRAFLVVRVFEHEVSAKPTVYAMLSAMECKGHLQYRLNR